MRDPSGANQPPFHRAESAWLGRSFAREHPVDADETAINGFCAAIGSDLGLRVVYAAAPLKWTPCSDILPFF